MSKARMYGYTKPYTPNAKADRRPSNPFHSKKAAPVILDGRNRTEKKLFDKKEV